MKVSVVRGAGFTGLVHTTSVDSSSLSSEAAQALRDRVAAAGLLGPPDPEPRAEHEPGTPDEVQIGITVEDEGGRHTVRFSGSRLSEPVQALLAWIEFAPGREERIEPPHPQAG